ncbi:hypothetical protein [Pseudomonas fluorescens]|uniref:hypothetical protein n=1 Tax=Pseudomonas fluorescens TaxID=294 RepID=UPI0005797C5C
MHHSADASDPLAAALLPGAAVGMLGIELHTRRRNRINGRIDIMTDASHPTACRPEPVSSPQVPER